MEKYFRSAVKNKWQKMQGPQSEKIAKNLRSAVRNKWQKIKCPLSKKNAKKSNICGQIQMPKKS